MPKHSNMARQTNFTRFLNEVKEYENVRSVWCAELIANGRQTIQSVRNSVDGERLADLMDSFLKFVSLLAQCDPDCLPEKITPSETINECSTQQNKNLDLVPKNDIVKMVNNNLQCPICNEWLIKATSTNCNHTFCEKCIEKWLRINKTCPVCRSLVHCTSTSMAIDDFISNLCCLFGGLIKERRESVKNALDDYEHQIILDDTVDGFVDDLSLSTESIVEDTYYNSLLETTTPFQHPNMVRLIPLHSDSPESRTNIRRVNVGSRNVHPNEVELLPFPRSSVASTQLNGFQSPFSSALSHRSNCRQTKLLTSVVTSAVNNHPNAVELLPFPRPSIISSSRLQVQPTNTPVASAQLNRFQSTSTSAYNFHANCVQLEPLTSTIKPHVCRSRVESSISAVGSRRIKCKQPTSSSSGGTT